MFVAWVSIYCKTDFLENFTSGGLFSRLHKSGESGMLGAVGSHTISAGEPRQIRKEAAAVKFLVRCGKPGFFVLFSRERGL